MIMYIIVVFLASLTLSAILLTQAETGLLTETRSDALISILSSHQNSDGSFPSFLSLPNETGDAYQTASVLSIANALGQLSRINYVKAENYVVSKQSMTALGNTVWGWPVKQLSENSNTSSSDLGGVYFILTTLKSINIVDRINKTTAIDFASARYNYSDGGFYEPLVNVQIPNGKVVKYAPMWFPLEFSGDSILTAYSESNMISTFLGVSVLSILGALGRINTTLTQQWILNSMGANGAFGPYPNSSDSISNPFRVDQYGTGLAFTFAAVSALKILGYFHASTLNETKIKQYVLSCQDVFSTQSAITRFVASPSDWLDNFVHYSYYAVETLRLIGALDNDTGFKVTNYLLNYLQDPSLNFVDSWPLPQRSDSNYGLFQGFPPMRENYFSILILNSTGNLGRMQQLTPITSAVLARIFQLSVLTGIFATCLSMLAVVIRARIPKRGLPREGKVDPTVTVGTVDGASFE